MKLQNRTAMENLSPLRQHRPDKVLLQSNPLLSGQVLARATSSKRSNIEESQIRRSVSFVDTSGNDALTSMGSSMHASVGHDTITTSAWLLVRNGAASSLAPGGQLGAGQAGVRAQIPAFDIGGHVGLGVNGRLSGALISPHQFEGALGVYLKLKGPVPGQFIAERRQNLGGGGRDAFAVFFATGIDDKPIPKGFRISGYGQAGIVGLSRKDLFVDGSLRVERELDVPNILRFRIGAGAWGAAQTGAARLDIGPRISTSLDAVGFRLNIGAEWRQRVAGSASPGSGPVIVIGTDYSK